MLKTNILLLLHFFAYIDPGSGSMIFQLIVGGIAGILLALKLFGHRILTLLGIRKKQEENQSS